MGAVSERLSFHLSRSLFLLPQSSFFLPKPLLFPLFFSLFQLLFLFSSQFLKPRISHLHSKTVKALKPAHLTARSWIISQTLIPLSIWTFPQSQSSKSFHPISISSSILLLFSQTFFLFKVKWSLLVLPYLPAWALSPSTLQSSTNSRAQTCCCIESSILHNQPFKFNLNTKNSIFNLQLNSTNSTQLDPNPSPLTGTSLLQLNSTITSQTLFDQWSQSRVYLEQLFTNSILTAALSTQAQSHTQSNFSQLSVKVTLNL